MPTLTAVKETEETLKVNEEKWTKPLLAAGFTCFPSIILEKQEALGLDTIDMNIVMHLTIYWWKKGSLPHPAIATIAKAIGKKPRTVQKHLQRLEAAGLITRIQRRAPGQSSKTNLYTFDGLIKEATRYAKEKTAARAERDAKEAARLARKRPVLEVVKP